MLYVRIVHPPRITHRTVTLFMSAFARSPESYAAWQQLKQNVALRPHRGDDEHHARRDRGTEELHRLLSRTSISISINTVSSFVLFLVLVLALVAVLITSV